MTPDASVPTMGDILAVSYRDALPAPEPTKADTALLLVDVQNMAAPDYLAEAAIEAGMERDAVQAALSDYRSRFDAALANCVKALDAARAAGIAPVHIRIQSLAADGCDTGLLHRRLGWRYPPGSKGTAFLPAAEPRPGEIALTKTASGGFTGTALDFTLRSMGVEHLFICGFVADECVETTLRQGLDLGYRAKIIEDATTSYFRESTEHSLSKFTSYGFTITSNDFSALMAGLSSGE
ncbi:cysteine hydrolase family protein [Alteriqipengyuania lutimaris]|uniref:Cysteine hydrolase n=1 Tax=Alteriqipengyuania lutimaris TaxID=1538146 RepID=A0A395LJ32_9SPHN|nr:isochorismatase family cysteine hydrolase [Alteriqipengyuania lutimaris]MBB3034860.1 nicotinamidase-related amidase [Alteriqipengyuania lutimaris]RDS76307.1 cysteine hydrolase [Alteriqipengyuania lutimaris]